MEAQGNGSGISEHAHENVEHQALERFRGNHQQGFTVMSLAICLKFGVILGVELLPWIAKSSSLNRQDKKRFQVVP